MICKVIEAKNHPNKAAKLELEATGFDDMELLTALAAAIEHRRCIRVFKTDDPNGRHFAFTSGKQVDGTDPEEQLKN